MREAQQPVPQELTDLVGTLPRKLTKGGSSRRGAWGGGERSSRHTGGGWSSHGRDRQHGSGYRQHKGGDFDGEGFGSGGGRYESDRRQRGRSDWDRE